MVLVYRAMLAGSLEITHNPGPAHNEIAPTIHVALLLPDCLGRFVLRFRSEVDPCRAPQRGLVVDMREQRPGDALTTKFGGGHHVLNVDVVGIVLATERDRRARDIVFDQHDRT